MDVITFTRHLLTAREDRLSTTQVEHHNLGPDTLHNTVNDLTLLLGIMLVLSITFGLADAL